MQEDTKKSSEQTADAAGAHGLMIVKCIIIPAGTIARCRVIRAVAGKEAEDLSHYVSCGVTEVRVSDNMAVVSLQRAAPPWKDLPSGLLDSEDVLKPREPVHRLEALGRWAKANPARYPLSVHHLLFVKSSEGWRANYQLPEMEGGVGEGP